MPERRVGITGHRGLPPETAKLITEQLCQVLDHLEGAFLGASLLADGPDSIFAAQVLGRGGEGASRD